MEEQVQVQAKPESKYKCEFIIKENNKVCGKNVGYDNYCNIHKNRCEAIIIKGHHMGTKCGQSTNKEDKFCKMHISRQAKELKICEICQAIHYTKLTVCSRCSRLGGHYVEYYAKENKQVRDLIKSLALPPANTPIVRNNYTVDRVMIKQAIDNLQNKLKEIDTSQDQLQIE